VNDKGLPLLSVIAIRGGSDSGAGRDEFKVCISEDGAISAILRVGKFEI
jgi:hypothetical protein